MLYSGVKEPVPPRWNPARVTSDWFAHTLTALRLLKPGYIGRFPTRIIGDPSIETAGVAISSPLEETDYVPSSYMSVRHAYKLSISEVEELGLLLDAVHKLSNTNLLIALSRLNHDYRRANELDRLIDAVIALESIYLIGVNNELKFRLAIRAAAHLGRVQ
jgi:hypothetical protein